MRKTVNVSKAPTLNFILGGLSYFFFNVNNYQQYRKYKTVFNF